MKLVSIFCKLANDWSNSYLFHYRVPLLQLLKTLVTEQNVLEYLGNPRIYQVITFVQKKDKVEGFRDILMSHILPNKLSSNYFSVYSPTKKQ